MFTFGENKKVELHSYPRKQSNELTIYDSGHGLVMTEPTKTQSYRGVPWRGEDMKTQPKLLIVTFHPLLLTGARRGANLTGLSAIMSSFLLCFLLSSCSVFFSLSGTSRSLDCMSLITSCSSNSVAKVRWHTGQQGSRSSVSWPMNWV